MNFAPYQDVDPERERALSPPPPDGRRSKSPQVRTPPTRPNASPPNLPHPNAFGNDYPSTGNNAGLGDRGVHIDAFQTSLPLRLDYEAMLAYILLPPAGPVLLLLTEHKSDYVRFHAWQSSMLFTCIFIVHLILSWSSVISWILFVGDVALIAFLALHAYRDVETLDYYEVPFFGPLANRFVDDE
ncbi:hypothetical protein GJ744_007051 [Endocarpon pusillum]|uniref:Uncharacterized protein n=1 Tax=Endocarpon pusillum TaxID=364733 RepID=A0A8H7ALC6_9EURO|nr:hypothetical protein GJ744_007051 [Endocarpon pusillum]